MSEWQQWAESAGLAILNWGIPFALGVLFRKRVARWFNTGKMRLLNDTISMNLISVRSYAPTEVSPCPHSMYDNIKGKISGTKLVNMYTYGLRISLPNYGIIKILIDKVTDEEEEHEEEDENIEVPRVSRVKVTVTPESPIKLGVRDIMQLSEFSSNIEVILGEIERECLEECHMNPGASYTLIELPRVGHFLEEKSFKKEDEDIGTTVYATDNKISLTVKTLSQIAKATKKYMFS